MRERLTILLLCCAAAVSAAEWSFSGGYMYFDNSVTKWADNSIMLIIGKDAKDGNPKYSSVYEMCPAPEATVTDGVVSMWYTPLPTSGWGDADYMAVIGGGSVWRKGNWSSDNLKNATHYTAAYTAGLGASAGQGFLFTPQSASNGCTITLTYRGTGYSGVTFTSAEKNACYKIDDAKQTITFIFSTSDKRFATSRSAISRVYVYGSVTAWNQTDEAYRLNGWSDDGCFFRTMPLSAIERVGNSGQPEFLFLIYKYKGGTDYGEADAYTDRAHSTWEGMDTRLLFDNNGINMIVALPGDDLDEIHQRSVEAQKVDALSAFDLTKPADQARIANWRLVPGTTQLYRSYHPFDPSREKYDTEERRLYWVGQLATQAGIQCDIALSGDMTGKAGQSYTCHGQSYTITIPDYYKTIIANNRVLYVGTANGHTPSYNTAIFDSGSDRFAQWIQEVVTFVLDEAHPAPFQIHCALGSDRTGAFCATIAAMCGASWEQIATDYEATSNLRVNEYRHRNCIRYCLKRMCGVDPATDDTFNEKVRKLFIDGGWLTEAQINALKVKLNGGATDNGERLEVSGERATKSLNDGIIVIQRDGKQYSVSGQFLDKNNKNHF